MLEQLHETLGQNASAVIVELIDSYLQETPKHLADIRTAVISGDAERLWQAAHTLKSSSAIFEAARLSDLFRELEFLGKTGAVTDLEEKLFEVEAEYQRVKANLEVEKQNLM